MWLCLCAGLTMLFGVRLFCTEINTKCVAAKLKDTGENLEWHNTFIRFNTVEEAAEAS